MVDVAWEGWFLWCEGRIGATDFDRYSLDGIDIMHHTLIEYRRGLAKLRDES